MITLTTIPQTLPSFFFFFFFNDTATPELYTLSLHDALPILDAFVDTYGDGYVELALALGVAAGRIDTIADFAAAAKHGVRTDGGTAAGPGATVLAELAGL